jgi:hypothetical protein
MSRVRVRVIEVRFRVGVSIRVTVKITNKVYKRNRNDVIGVILTKDPYLSIQMMKRQSAVLCVYSDANQLLRGMMKSLESLWQHLKKRNRILL